MRYTCPKCGQNQCDVGEVYMAASLIIKIVKIQNRKLTSVTCKKCTHPELFKTELKRISNFIDFFVG